MKTRTVLALLVLLAFSSLASSCPVCYGQTDSNTASAVNAGIIALLLVTGTVLSFFASLFIHLRRRYKLSLVDTSNESQRVKGS
ncbi:MAG TPA: hypothetical protein VI758_13885 [Bacteroidota bacterium]